MTFTRIGFDDYVDLEIDNEFFEDACMHYGRDRKVLSMTEAYERVIEIMLDMGIPLYAYSTFPYDNIYGSEFNMFVHKDYAEEVNRILNILPHAVDRSFFNSDIYKHDDRFTDLIAGIIKSHMYGKEKERLLEDDDWMEIER